MDDETTTEETTESTTTDETTDEQPADEQEDHHPRHTRQLPCAMTDAELLEVGDQIDELISAAEDLEAEKKSSASSYKSQIDATVERLQKLSKLRRRRTVEREVEVEVLTDLARAEETVTRLDTGETVSKRTLSSREVEEQRQVKLPLAPAAAQGEGAAGDDPWERLPLELAGLVEAIDQADAHGERLPEAIATDYLRALVAWAKERGIPPTDERIAVVVKEIAARRKEERRARPKRTLPSVTDPATQAEISAEIDAHEQRRRG